MDINMKKEMNYHSIAMIVISILAGLLSTMNVWVYNIEDIRFHINDLYMATLMTGWMLLFQTIIFYNQIASPNIFFIISIIIIVISFICIRYQIFVSETQYLKGMIPHHSMAILMSEKIKEKTNDPEIIDMANKIIVDQQKEINKMNNLLKQY